MFIFMGLMLDKSGTAERMMHAMQELFGKVRGGLAVTVTVIGIILAASTGIIGASVVLLGVMSLPAMMNQGYHKSLATICGAGCLVGFALFYLKGVCPAEVTMIDIYKGVTPWEVIRGT